MADLVSKWRVKQRCKVSHSDLERALVCVLHVLHFFELLIDAFLMWLMSITAAHTIAHEDIFAAHSHSSAHANW